MLHWLLRPNSQRTWRAMKGSWPILIYCEAICLERLRKISEIFQNNRSSVGNVNPGPPKHETAGPKLERDVRWCQVSLSIPDWTQLQFPDVPEATNSIWKRKFIFSLALQLLVLFSDWIVQVYCVWREGRTHREKVYSNKYLPQYKLTAEIEACSNLRRINSNKIYVFAHRVNTVRTNNRKLQL